MDGPAPHFGFILAAYLATALVLGALVAWIVLDGRAIRRRLAEMEARGHRRRSERSAAAPRTAGLEAAAEGRRADRPD